MIQEKIVVGSGGDFPLNGLLTIPDNSTAPHPAVVFVHGSGASDMNSKVYEVRPFKDLAEGLAKLGVASIRYDKRSFTHGKQMVKALGGSLTVWEEAIEDAVLAAAMLRDDPRIDPDRVFIVGLSLGGHLAPRIDAEGGDFAGLIIMAGSPRRLEEIIREQQNEYLKNARGLIKWIAGKQIKKIAAKLDNIYTLSDEEAKMIPFAGGTSIYYLKEMGEKPVADYLKDLNKPILVMHPEKDVQVSLEKDFGAYKEILRAHPRVTFKLYEGLNHAFMPSIYGTVNKAMKEFKVPQNVDPRVISDMADWMKSV